MTYGNWQPVRGKARVFDLECPDFQKVFFFNILMPLFVYVILQYMYI